MAFFVDQTVSYGLNYVWPLNNAGLRGTVENPPVNLQ